MDPVKFILALYALWLKIVLFTSYNPIHSFKKIQQITFHIFTAHPLSLFMSKILGLNPATLQKLKSVLLIFLDLQNKEDILVEQLLALALYPCLLE